VGKGAGHEENEQGHRRDVEGLDVLEQRAEQNQLADHGRRDPAAMTSFQAQMGGKFRPFVPLWGYLKNPNKA
jgi:hypothetical protein